MSGKLTLITPTGDRPEAFGLCEFWMSRQTVQPDLQWIVVDDGCVPMLCTMGQEYVRREPGRTDAKHTLAVNLRMALPLIRHERVLIIEDDDYYGPRYFQQMLEWMEEADLVGEIEAKYYNVRLPGWNRHCGHKHASLCRTGFKATVVPTLTRMIESDNPTVDLRLWKAWKGSRLLWPDQRGDARLCVGMKGMPGRPGHTWRQMKGYTADPNLQALKTWVGPDYRYYMDLIPELRRVGTKMSETHGMSSTNPGQESLIVYTAIFGGYDHLQPVVPEPGIDLVAFVDEHCPTLSAGGLDGLTWNVNSVDKPPAPSHRRVNRWYKMRPHVLFPDAEWTLYVDGAMEPLRPLREFVEWARSQGDGDFYAFGHNFRNCVYAEAAECLRIGKGEPLKIQAQIARYCAAGVPAGAGLWQGGVLLRRNCAELAAFNETWWRELELGSARDQLSLGMLVNKLKPKMVTLPHQARDKWFCLHHVHPGTRKSSVNPGTLRIAAELMPQPKPKKFVVPRRSAPRLRIPRRERRAMEVTR